MRRLRVVGAVFLAVLALAGLAAQGAGASVFKAGSYPATISGSQEGKHAFKTVANELNCNKYSFAGKLTEASSELALAGSPTECSTAGFLAMSVAMNGCTFDFGSGAEFSAGKFSGSFAIACPAGKEIVWSGGNGCTAKIPPQAVSATVTLENTATEPKSLLLTTAASGIEYTLEKSFFCVGSPSPGTYVNGVYEGKTKLTAANSEATPIDLTID